jgi:D-3-phosphoglycerate dehydrogenase / 2-oxoglutarate reductase
VGIFGYGNAGSSLAKKLTGFGCQVIAYDKYLDKLPDNNARMVNLKTFFDEAEVVSLHIPLTDETHGMVNLEFFNKFAKPIIFLNTSRGEIVPLADLKAVVEDKKVKMAALDVLECEKLDKMTAKQAAAFSWLKDSGKVIFTPHVAGWTVESYRRINVVLVEKIAAFLDHG